MAVMATVTPEPWHSVDESGTFAALSVLSGKVELSQDVGVAVPSFGLLVLFQLQFNERERTHSTSTYSTRDPCLSRALRLTLRSVVGCSLTLA